MSISQIKLPKSKTLLVGVLAIIVVVAVIVIASSGGNTKKASASQLIVRAVAAERKGNLKLAAADYNRAIAKSPKNSLAYYDLGTVYVAKKLDSMAVREFRKSVKLDSKFTRAWFNLAVLESKSSYTRAVSDYRSLLKVDRGYAQADFNLGLLLIQHNSRTAGLIDLNLAVTMDKKLLSNVPAALKPYVHASASKSVKKTTKKHHKKKK
jgi:tetratricopeptide (TPR) repeat protein